MKEIVKLGVILLVVCIIAAVALAFTNELTKDQISIQRDLASEEARKSILPSAESFKLLDEGKLNEIISKNNKVSEVFVGYKGDSIVGYTFKTLPAGYAGTIEIMTGIVIDGKVSGVRVGNHQETPGLGAKAGEEEFSGQFTGKKGVKLVKGTATNDDEVSAIAAATITSRAIVDGANQAIEVSGIIMESKND